MSEIFGKRIIRTSGPSREVNVVCVGCGGPVKPGMCYTGSVVKGTAYRTMHGSEQLPILGTTEVRLGHAPNDYSISNVIGGEIIPTQKRVGFLKREKGFLCDSCAANYHTVTDANGVKHPLVITDARPGFLGETVAGERAHKAPRSKGFNTRVTQGHKSRI